MQHHVFISYSHRNADVMQRIKSDLTVAGLSVWTDEAIKPGTQSWRENIEEAISQTGCLVLLMSSDAKKSSYVRAELDYAALQEKHVFPVLVGGDERKVVPIEFSGAQWVDLRNERSFTSEIEKLIDSIKEETSTIPSHSSAIETLPPPFEWCIIPGGTLRSIAAQQIEPFWIAKYPVTSQQFELFHSDPDGYANLGLWEQLPPSSQRWFRHIRSYQNPSFTGGWCPRESVNWHEAIAFCYWLSGKLDLSITLPTKEQRIWVVQGEGQIDYPWGMEFDSTRCNTREAYFDRTTSVTKYPLGASRHGVMDLSGNVWEWSLTEHKNYNGETEGCLVFGGGWRSRRRHARATFLRWHPPEYHAPDVGFRICAEL